MLGYLGASPNNSGGNTAIRLDSSYTYSDVDSLRRYRLGDFINGGLSWTRPVRLGGAQVSADFSMRPDLVTFPLPSLSGSVAVPSTVDVLVNGSRLFSRDLLPGPFQIPHLPVITGAGTVSMTLTDALGRQVVTTLPFYASANLLASGLQTYSMDVGAVRRNWGIVSNDYDQMAVSGTYRRGVSSNLTVEAHTESTPGAVMAGGGAVVNVFDLGVFNAAAAGSGHAGGQLSIGAQRQGRVFSIGASAIVANRNFRDIAAMNGDPVPRRQINANAGLTLSRFGSFGLAYTGIDRDAVPIPVSFFAPGLVAPPTTSLPGGTASDRNGTISYVPAQHSHILSATYSMQFGPASIYATGFHDFATQSGDSSGVLFGLTIPLGGRSSATVSGGTGSSGGYAQAQVTQSPVSVGDWGYQVFGASNHPSHEFGVLQYKSPWALVSAGADRMGSQTTLRAEAQGALAAADGGVFASNTINDSFAVVDTSGMKDVRVLNENREVGRTDSAGRLLVPDLRAFDVNHLAIEPTDVPADATVPFTTRDVRPQDRAGVVVRFPVRVSHGALLRLVDEAGQPIPVGSTGTLVKTGSAVPVGYDGEAFVEDLEAGTNRLRVERPDGRRCVAVFTYRAVPGDIPTIGPLRCKEQTP